jgi:hypothetical protein
MHHTPRLAAQTNEHALERVLEWLALWLEARGLTVDRRESNLCICRATRRSIFAVTQNCGHDPPATEKNGAPEGAPFCLINQTLWRSSSGHGLGNAAAPCGCPGRNSAFSKGTSNASWHRNSSCDCSQLTTHGCVSRKEGACSPRSSSSSLFSSMRLYTPPLSKLRVRRTFRKRLIASTSLQIN